jgi:hypothetical protein
MQSRGYFEREGRVYRNIKIQNSNSIKQPKENRRADRKLSYGYSDAEIQETVDDSRAFSVSCCAAFQISRANQP